MASKGRQSSSESDLDPRYATITDEKKRKRMISNRESARRSRKRKQMQLEDLMKDVADLKTDNASIMEKINASSQRYNEMESQNNVLRAQAMELTDRLRSLNSVLQVVEEVSGFELDIPEVPEAFQNPWHTPYPEQRIMASTEIYQC